MPTTPGTDEPSWRPVPLKIQAEASSTTKGTGSAPGLVYPLYSSPVIPVGERSVGGALQVFPVTSIGSPDLFSGSSVESR